MRQNSIDTALGISPLRIAECDQFHDTLCDVASALAECLQRSDFSVHMSCELERKGICGLANLENLTPDEAYRNVLDVLEANSWILDLPGSRQVPENDKGQWAIENILGNISNEDH